MKVGHDSRRFVGARPGLVLALTATSLLIACSNSNNDSISSPASEAASLDSLSPVLETRHEGERDGLLGGFGLSGLLSPPEFYADAANPTPSELRRATLHANYIALVDRSASAGFGTLYGPTDDTRFPGSEFRAFVGDGINRATLMLHLPDSFDKNAPCLVAAPSSGSRNAYGAVGTSGDWALSKGCAVAYTDANKGTGAVELTQNKGFNQSLELIDLANTDEEATFRVPTSNNVGDVGLDDYAQVELPSDAELADYIEANPDRYAFKHAHSQKNVEKDWGLHTLQSVQFALDTLSEKFDSDFTPDNTLIIGASVSNGGAAVLRAAEASNGDVFDGLVAGEPNINPARSPLEFSINMEGREPVSEHATSLMDNILAAELYAGCASKAPINANAVFAELRGDTTARCEALVSAGLLNPGDITSLGEQANQKLLDTGYLQESSKLLVGYSGIDLFQSLLATYGNAYTRSSVVDALCSISMAHVPANTFSPAPYPQLTTLAANSNGIPRTSDVFLIKDNSPSGPVQQIAAPSSSGDLDYNLEGALCWKAIRDNAAHPLNERLRQGINEVTGSGNLHGVPTIIVHGRDDALIPVNYSSRSYYALNQQIEGDNSALFYYEVPHAQHLDSLNFTYAKAGMNYLPIDYYFKQSLDLMYAHLTEGSALPESQVVNNTAPENGIVTLELLGGIDAEPDTAKVITYADNVLNIPQ